MKTAEEIYDMINSRSGKVWNKKEIAMMVAGVYAQQACEDLRERIADNSFFIVTDINEKVLSKGQLGWIDSDGNHCEVDKQSILNTEIILP